MNIDINGCSCLAVSIKAPVVPGVVAYDSEEGEGLAEGAIAAACHSKALLSIALVIGPGPVHGPLTTASNVQSIICGYGEDTFFGY